MHSSHDPYLITMNVDSLIKAYKNTLFKIDGFMKPIIVGTKSPEVDQYLKENAKSSWAFITAYNPMSKIESDEINTRNQSLLEGDIQEYSYLCGHGEDPNDNWIPEPSFFIAGISKSDAIKLGNKYRQLAIVIGKLNVSSELIILEY
jgi:hypothetical protein|tara:strand:- start:2020 stop:2460 length:441 start_codon:yes stop_codon:yes gene_type:complete